MRNLPTYDGWLGEARSEPGFSATKGPKEWTLADGQTFDTDNGFANGTSVMYAAKGFFRFSWNPASHAFGVRVGDRRRSLFYSSISPVPSMESATDLVSLTMRNGPAAIRQLLARVEADPNVR